MFCRAAQRRINRHKSQQQKALFTMVLLVAAAAARRRIGMMAAQQQRRTMAAHAPAPEWTGIDKVVRGYFPQDYQRACPCYFILFVEIPNSVLITPLIFTFTLFFAVAMAIMGGYFGLFTLYKIKSALGGKPVEAPAAPAPTTAFIQTTGVPSVDTPEFDKYLETDAFYNMLDDDEQLAKVVEDMK
jgi:hypothetical protein